MLIDKLRQRNPAISPYIPVDSDCALYHAYWDGTAIDHSTYGNTGTLVGTHSSFGQLGLSIVGVNPADVIPPEGIIVPYSSSLGFTDLFSVEEWVYVPADSVGFSCSQGDFETIDWKFQIAGQGGLYFGYFPEGYPDYGFVPVGSFPTDSWYHITYTFDYSLTHTIHCYINGIEYFAPPSGQWPFYPEGLLAPLRNSTNQTVNIGFAQLGNLCATDVITIGEVRLWKKVISQSDVTSIFNATKSRYGL